MKTPHFYNPKPGSCHAQRVHPGGRTTCHSEHVRHSGHSELVRRGEEPPLSYIFLTIALTLCLTTAAYAQTSFGGIEAAGTTAGTGGNNTNAYFGHQAGLVNTGTNNTFIGGGSGEDNTGGNNNTYVGYQSGRFNTIGAYNAFLGYQSGFNNNANYNTFLGAYSGYANTSGVSNTFIGYNSGHDNTTGGSNTFIGGGSGLNNTTGEGNTFIGVQSGVINETGSYNAFLGNNSGLFNTGSYNAFIGCQSGLGNGNGSNNAALGYEAGYSTVGSNNISLGFQAGRQASGSNNVFLGYQAGYNELGSNLLYIENSDSASPLIWGDFANDLLRFNGSVAIATLPQNDTLSRVLVSDTDGNLHWRDDTTLRDNHEFPSYPASAGDGGDITNAYFGHQAGLLNTGTHNTFIGNSSGLATTTGYENSSLGSRTLENNTTGARNTANGVYTLFANTTGNENTAVGYAAMGFNTAGIGNTATGVRALLNNTDGIYNTAVGYQALHSNQSGVDNVAMGHDVLYSNTSGNHNIALGRDALALNTTGSGNVAIGYTAGPTVGNNTLQNTVAIGYAATVQGNNAIVLGNNAQAQGANAMALGNGALANANQVRIGNSSIMSIGGYQPWSNLSDGRFKKEVREDIPGLAFIEQLRPVSYQLDTPKLNQFLKKEPSNTNGEAKAATTSRRNVGFLAQEVEQVLTKNGYAPIGVETPQSENDLYSLRYSEFVVPLTKAVQELSTLVKTLQQQNEAQQQRIETLERLVGTAAIPALSDKTTSTEALPQGIALYQNAPNPFTQTTVIGAQVPENVQQAKIVVYNLQGLELASYPLRERGKVTVEISGKCFPAGMYLYALVADGKVIDTKKMLLTN